VITNLLLLPYNDIEEDHLIDYCQKETASTFVKSFLVLYYIHHGRFVQAIRHYETQKLLSLSGDSAIGTSSIVDPVMDAITQTIRKLLPAVQRHALEIELEMAMEPYQATGWIRFCY
jgi:hypothetical protein